MGWAVTFVPSGDGMASPSVGSRRVASRTQAKGGGANSTKSASKKIDI